MRNTVVFSVVVLLIVGLLAMAAVYAVKSGGGIATDNAAVTQQQFQADFLRKFTNVNKEAFERNIFVPNASTMTARDVYAALGKAAGLMDSAGWQNIQTANPDATPEEWGVKFLALKLGKNLNGADTNPMSRSDAKKAVDELYAVFTK
jgi:hypothetical protein